MFRWWLCLGLLCSALLWQVGDPEQAQAQRGRGGARPMMVQPMMARPMMVQPMMARPMMTTPASPGTFRPAGLPNAPAMSAIRPVTPTRTFDQRVGGMFDRRVGDTHDQRIGDRLDRHDGDRFDQRLNGTFDQRFGAFDPRVGGTSDPRVGMMLDDPRFR